MSKDRKKLLHIHSSVNDKQPTPETLELGELGINNAKGNAFISTKNSDGEVVRFSEDDTIINWMEMKEVFPYKGYVRGSGETQVNGVTEQDLLENKSNLIIKINQVAAQNSEHDLDINGAKDIYGNLVNPMSPDGMRDGAGFAIDMSLYAMQGANPSFSSITTTCNAKLEGTTKIMGSADSDCGSKLDVKVENVDVQSFDSTVLKSDNSTLITSPVVDTNACNHISSRTNNFVVTECVNGEGSVVIDTTNVNVSANTIYNKSCDGITSETNNFVVTECNNGEGSVTIDTTEVNVSADTTNVKSCEGVGIDTDSFVVTECNDGEGDVIIDTTNINVSANTSNIKSCEGVNTNTDNFVIAECNEGSGNVIFNTTIVEISADTTEVKSCSAITLESDNLVLRGCTEDGKVTISTNDLCLVGEEKVNVYGNETNIGLDCVCEAGTQNIADKTRVFGKGILITNKDICSAETEDGVVNVDSTNDVNVYAANNICNMADSAATLYGVAKSNVGVSCDGTVLSEETMVRGGKTVIDASTSNLGLTAKEDILESAEGDIVITANESICEQAGDAASFYGVETTRVGKSCDGSTNTNNLEIGGSGICIDADDRISVYGANKSDFGISCDGEDISTLTNIRGDKVIIGNRVSEWSDDGAFIKMEDSSLGIYSNYIGIQARQSVSAIADESVSVVGAEETYIGCERGDDTTTDYLKLESFDAIDVDCIDGIININSNRGEINVSAGGQICVETETSAFFYGAKGTVIGQGCDRGAVSEYINYYRTPDMHDSAISSTTVDGALDEVFDRSKVTVVPTPNPSGDSGETWITYTLYQDNQNIGEINVLKDHLIEDARVVYGTVADDGQGGQTFTPCNGSSDCHWYIELKWFVKDGSHIDKYTYLDANAFVKDISAKTDSNRGVNVDVWYDSVSGMNFVSADTTLHFSASTSGFSYEKRDGEHWISATTLEFVEGSFSAETYNPFKESKTVKVPTSMQHLSQYNGSCYEFDADVCMSGHTIVAEAFYNTSDINLKENIKPIDDDAIAKVNEIEFKSFNFKADETKKQVYGVIAQDVENVGLSNLVNKNNDGVLSVDYIQLLVLKIQSLENEIKQLKEELNKK